MVYLSEENIELIKQLLSEKKRVEGITETISIEEVSDNDFNLCTQQYVYSRPEWIIEIGNINKYTQANEDVMIQLMDVEKKLSSIRQRFL